MPTPTWSSQYDFGLTPEENGFTRISYGPSGATVTLTTIGNTSNRKVTLTETNPSDGVSFVINNVPNLNPSVGFTAEMICAVLGDGDAGVELRYSDGAIGLNIFQTRVLLTIPGSNEIVVDTVDNSVDTLWRLTCNASREIRVYRDGIQVTGPHIMPASSFPQASYQWWGESGGTQVIKAQRVYFGGAVIPG